MELPDGYSLNIDGIEWNGKNRIKWNGIEARLLHILIQ